jgi:hypothetical protein
MQPSNVGVFIILVVAVTAIVFVITRARLEQGTSRVPVNEIAQNVGRDFRQLFGGIFSLVGIIMWFIFIVAVTFAGLWLVVAAVKWMWQHS